MATRIFLKIMLNTIQVQPMELSKLRQSLSLRFIRVLDDLKTKKTSVVLAFLSYKSKDSYKFFLSVLALKCEKIGKRFSPISIFMTDYKKNDCLHFYD